MAGKGSSPRKVNLESYGKNYDSIFTKEKTQIDELESIKNYELYKELMKTVIKLNTSDEN